MPRTTASSHSSPNRKEVIGKAVRNLTSKGKARVLPTFPPMKGGGRQIPLPIKGPKVKNVPANKRQRVLNPKGHPYSTDTELSGMHSKVKTLVHKPKNVGKDKGDFRKVGNVYKQRRFTAEQRKAFRKLRNVPSRGPTGGRPPVDPGSLT